MVRDRSKRGRAAAWLAAVVVGNLLVLGAPVIHASAQVPNNLPSCNGNNEFNIFGSGGFGAKGSGVASGTVEKSNADNGGGELTYDFSLKVVKNDLSPNEITGGLKASLILEHRKIVFTPSCIWEAQVDTSDNPPDVEAEYQGQASNFPRVGQSVQAVFSISTHRLARAGYVQVGASIEQGSQCNENGDEYGLQPTVTKGSVTSSGAGFRAAFAPGDAPTNCPNPTGNYFDPD